MRGSLVGVGTDIAGSIRIPSLCCGITGFKPSPHRVAYDLQSDAVREGDPLMETVPPVAGPLCHSVRDARLFMETVVQEKYFNYDFTTLPVPWRPQSIERKLVIGLVSEAPDQPVSPPMRRAVTTAAEKLKAAGHTIIELKKYPSFADVYDLIMNSFAYDNHNIPFKWVTDSGEPFTNSVIKNFGADNMPDGTRTLDDLYPDTLARDAYKKAWHAIFRDSNLDVILAPGNNCPAPPHDTCRLPTYCMMWNYVQVNRDQQRHC
jgi:amidase